MRQANLLRSKAKILIQTIVFMAILRYNAMRIQKTWLPVLCMGLQIKMGRYQNFKPIPILEFSCQPIPILEFLNYF